MNNNEWQEIFTAQVRGLQALYPCAHRALKNWGVWSREMQGIFPSVAKPGWTEFYQAPEEWAEEADLEAATVVAQAEVVIRNDPTDRPRSDERLGEEIDIRIHRHGFPTIWRRVLRAAYVSQEIPEYEFPRHARVGYDGFLTFFESALEHLEKQIEVAPRK